MLKKQLFFFLLLIFGFSLKVFPTHLVGGYAGYEYLGRVGNTDNYRYRVYLKVYRDCNSTVDYDPYADVCFYNNANNKLVKAERIYRGKITNVDPVGKTECPEIIRTCIESCTYETVVTLPKSSFGYTFKWERCCRNTQENLPNDYVQGIYQPTQGQTYLATIPPTSINNSSPYFTEVPVPYICINDTTQIRSFAVDPDGDSLVFKFVRPWAGADPFYSYGDCEVNFPGPVLIQYNPGYDEKQPFGFDGYSEINQFSGTMTVMSKHSGSYALAVDVEEYREGILLSKVRLDIQLIVINCPPNKKPYLSGSSRVFTREVVAGEKICFNVTASDDDNGQKVSLNAFGDIFTGEGGWEGPTATFRNSSGVNTTTSQFCWETTCEQGRVAPYVFVVEAIDDGCPPKFINETYNIIVKPFESKILISGDNPVCMGTEIASYRISNLASGSTYKVEVENGDLISESGNDLKIKWDFSKTNGKITITETSKGGCVAKPVTLNVVLLPKPKTPIISAPDSACVDENIILKLMSNAPGEDHFWIMPTGAIRTTETVVFNSPDTGLFNFRHFIKDEFGCLSDTADKQIRILKPLSNEIYGPKTACPNNGNIEFYVDGYPGSTYQWFIDGASIDRGQGTDTIALSFGEPSVVVLKCVETNILGCIGDTLYHSINVTYDLIIEEPVGERDVCEFTKREKYIPYPFVHNTIYYWGVDGGDIDEIDSEYFLLYVNWGSAGNGEISYYQTAYDTLNSKQCISNTVKIDIDIHPIPETSVIEGEFEVCQGSDSMIFSVNGFPNSEFVWEINGSRKISGQGSNTIKFPTDNYGDFTISVYEISEFGCEGTLIDSNFTIYPRPVTSPISGDDIICFPDYSNKKYSVTGFPTSSFYWNVNFGEFKNDDLLPNIAVDWLGEQNNLIKIYEVSDFGCVGDTQYLEVFIDSPAIDIKYVSVTPPPLSDNKIIVSWELINAPRYNSDFRIFKRRTNPEEAFSKTADITGNIFEYVDSKVNTKESPYDYQIRGSNLCKDEILSPIHRSVLLTKDEGSEYTADMDFTEYRGWHEGVLQYVVYRQLLNKTPFEEYDWEQSPVRLHYENGADHYTQCYRIKALENDGREEVSWSNEVCFNYPPTMYIPNAFSPDGNGLNDGFGVTSVAIKDFRMKIFNRWGELLFETDDLQKTWDGTYGGVEVKQDVYVFFVEYTDFADNKYNTKGTFNLLR